MEIDLHDAPVFNKNAVMTELSGLTSHQEDQKKGEGSDQHRRVVRGIRLQKNH